MFQPRKYLYKKKATGMQKPEMYSVSRCNQNPTYLCGVVCTEEKIPKGCYGYGETRNNPTYLCGPSKYRRRQAQNHLDGNMAMVLCLHYGKISTKRKLRVWRDQKCIPLIGAITPLTYAGRQNTPSRVRQYRAQNGKLGKL